MSAGVAEMTIFAYGAIRCAEITSSSSSPAHALHDPKLPSATMPGGHFFGSGPAGKIVVIRGFGSPNILS